ncbi:MAG: hypothetical protein OSB39_09705, partial [Opitutales bacterium]|nr:hypothetical protein [Opitutales bacterium]
SCTGSIKPKSGHRARPAEISGRTLLTRRNRVFRRRRFVLLIEETRRRPGPRPRGGGVAEVHNVLQ